MPTDEQGSFPNEIGPGHNQPQADVAQWQKPHLPEGTKVQVNDRAAPDFDLVEASFVEGFSTASDPTSFLRLAGVPFSAVDGDGKTLSLLRVQLDQTTDVGSITPHLGGQSYHYDPLPTKMVSKRRSLLFIYHDGAELKELSLAAARGLTFRDQDTSQARTA